MSTGPGAGTGATGELRVGVWVESQFVPVDGDWAVVGSASTSFGGLFGPDDSFELVGESFVSFEGRSEPIGAFAVEGTADVRFSAIFSEPGRFAVVGESAITVVAGIEGGWSAFELEAVADARFDGYFTDADYFGEFHVEAHGDLGVFWSPDVSGGIASAGCQPAPAEAVLVDAAASAGGQDGPSGATEQDDPADVDCIEGPATAIVGYEGDSDA